MSTHAPAGFAIQSEPKARTDGRRLGDSNGGAVVWDETSIPQLSVDTLTE